MEKSAIIDDAPRNSVSAGRVLVVLAGAVAALAIAFVVLVACGTWYIGHLQQSCDTEVATAAAKVRDEYDVDVVHNKTTSPEHVVVDNQMQTTFVIIRAPETNHIQYLMTSDYRKNVDVLYDTEAHACYVAYMDDDHPSFQEDVALLRNYNGEDVAKVKPSRWTIGDPITDLDIIPEQMTSFCTLLNSHWLEEEDTRSPDERQKRRACYFRCSMSCTIWGGCRYVCGLRCTWG